MFCYFCLNISFCLSFVLQVKPVKKSGSWEVTSKDVRTGSISTELFDAVMVCSGHHAEKNMPHFEGEDQFLGQILHSHDYRDPRGYEDKRVVVVGIGNSAVDVAVELGRNSKQVG